MLRVEERTPEFGVRERDEPMVYFPIMLISRIKLVHFDRALETRD